MSNNTETVSIVLPTFNGANYIRQSIDSCLGQTYTNIELVIVDDASSDNTAQIIKGYNDERIIYLPNKHNLGLPRSLNAGFTRASGSYLSWTSDDNFYAPDAIEQMIGFLRQKQADFVYCDYYAFSQNDSVQSQGKPLYQLRKLSDTPRLEKVNHIGACFLYTRRVKEKTGAYDPECMLVEDLDYWIRVAKNFSLIHFGKPLYYFRAHGKSLYKTRFWEVEIAKTLVRLRHRLITVDQALGLYLDLIMRKKFLVAKNRILAKLIYFKNLNTALDRFCSGVAGFSETKTTLNTIIL